MLVEFEDSPYIVGGISYDYHAASTRDRAARILEIISERSLLTVCGYNFVTEFDRWHKDFKRLLDRAKLTNK